MLGYDIFSITVVPLNIRQIMIKLETMEIYTIFFLCGQLKLSDTDIYFFISVEIRPISCSRVALPSGPAHWETPNSNEMKL
jgi:hypothetical protein